MEKQTKIKGLPVFKAVLSDDCGMTKISFVEAPAVEKDFIAYAQDKAPRMYAVEDEEKRLAFGVVMRANYPIYRRDPDGFEYFITHSPEFIRDMVEKYLDEGLQNKFSTDHKTDVGDVHAVQFFIKDSSRGIAPAGFDEVEDGSLFGEFHVLNDDVWNGIKDGSFKGFSIEVFEELVPATGVVSTEKVAQDVLDYLDGYGRRYNLNEDIMNIFTKFKDSLARAVADPGAGAAPQSYGSVSTDKGNVHWDGDEDLKAGDAVFGLDADGERIALPDDNYTTEDDKVIVVVDGKVSEIRDAEAEVAPQEEETTTQETAAAEAQMAAQRAERIARYEETYDEKMRKIRDAIQAVFPVDGYLYEAGDTFAVLVYWSEATNWEDRVVRFDISWDADGNAIAANPVEGHIGFVADEEPAAAEPAAVSEESAQTDAFAEVRDLFEKLDTRIAGIEQRIGENERRIDEYGKRPLAPSARAQYRAQGGGKESASAIDECRDLLRRKK